MLKFNKFIKLSLILILLFMCTLYSCKDKKGNDKDDDFVSEVTITNKIETIEIGQSYKINYTVDPNTAPQDVIITSSNPDYVSINEDIIKGIKKGSSTIRVTSSSNQDIYDEFSINVVKSTASIDLTASSLEIYIGETLELTSVVTPSTISQEVEYSWLPAKEKTTPISLEGNIVTGLEMGKAYITATLKADNSIFSTICVNILHQLLEDPTSKAECIVGSPGEDANTMFNIHYQIKNTKSYALVTEESDVNFEHATAYYGTGRYFHDFDVLLDGKFVGRNVWHIVCTGLKPDTKYIYKVNNGDDTYSDIYHFRTGGSGKTSFLYLTDTHYYMGTVAGDTSANVSESTIKRALEVNPDISFVLGGGDRIDTGGNDNIWKLYFELAHESLTTLPFIDVPGNHEYYYHNTGQRDNSYYAVYNGASLNGPGLMRGSTSWFKINDVLFLLIDNNKNTSFEEQIAWMQDLLENQDYKYSVVVHHNPTCATNTYYEPAYIDVNDKYNVDLVLSGHTHSQEVLPYYYDNAPATTDEKGTTYFRGAFSGVKSTTAAEAINKACGYIFDITDEKIMVRKIFANGTVSTTWEFTSRKTSVKQEASKQELLDSITMNPDEENNNVTFNWSSKFYGNVKKVIVNETNYGELSDYSVFPTDDYTSLTLDKINYGFEYKFDVQVIFEDGSIEHKYFTIDRGLDLGLNVDADDSFAFIYINEIENEFKYTIKYFDIYLDDGEEKKYIGKWTYLNGLTPKTEYLLEDLESGTTYTFILEAHNQTNQYVFANQIQFTTLE